ncbi:hypothetical protein NP233_g3032 [Leucocoprinus birnbaumii]|uniref:Rhomboid-type serine protease n=1 Tax=Leucocoprinus birnbaumii TaxID=56174 RepID=A0AAD5VZ38_9AGAR|nr:hypothetical protein NP233_g3032 [Leucocoprinus birnbaumii]
MTSRDNQYSDPFTDRPGHQGDINSQTNFGASYTDADTPSYYSPSMITARTSGDLVSTHQTDYVQRRQSNSGYSTHSKSRSMDKSGTAALGAGGGGAAAEFYNSGPTQNHSDFLNAGAGAGGKDGGSRLSQLTEDDEEGYGFSQKYANPSYAAGLDGDVKTRPYDPHEEDMDMSLVKNAAPGRVGYSDLEYAEPPMNGNPAQQEKGNAFTKFLASGKYPLEQRIEDKKRGIGRQRYAFVVWALTLTMIGVFIWELIFNAREQGTPISMKPVVNPMLGPSSSGLITLGARFPACMKEVTQIPLSTNLPCANDTANPPDRVCPLESVCGFGGFHGSSAPNQWFRFITPIFLHAGIVHILLNMLAQMTLSAQIEREMGSMGFLITYFAGGIFGNVLGGNFSLVGVPSVGASGAIFSSVAVTWVDLFAHWKYHYRPVRRLIFQTIELVIGVAIGYIPYVDNFAHIGGFVMGLLVGTVFYPVISETRRHRLITWAFKLAAIPLAIILYVVLIRNFYTSDPYAACSGCRYLSCFPTAANNRCQGTGLTSFQTNTNTGLLALGLATVFGLLRSTLFDWLDPMHCHALLSTGTWLDDDWNNWQPDGCMLHSYTSQDSAQCLKSQNVIFVGDSVTRQLFFQFANILDRRLPLAPTNKNEKHADHVLQASTGTQLTFYWDPYLNDTRTADLLTTTSHDVPMDLNRPALLVLGSGLWYLRHADETGGVSGWQSNTARHVSAITRQPVWPADLTVMLPVERVVPSKLTPERALTMHPSDIDAMNSDLYHRVYQGGNGLDRAWLSGGPPGRGPIALPRVFNEMLDASQTDDGLHFSDKVLRAQANVLLNLRCNDALPKKYPFNKTCCNRYPVPSPVHALLLILVLAWGPIAWLRTRTSGSGAREVIASFLGENEIPALSLSAAALLIYVADRTGLWLKEQKQFDFWAFTFLSLGYFAFGILTVRKGEKDLGFLNRDQTDEWKGWMQLAILVYHYFGASKISGIYNPIRVLVASYLFMTGYGHTTFYLRKADFSFGRVAQIMVRLNLLTVLLAYTMNTDYMFYYFAPLVSMWYIIIYATLLVASQYNERTSFLLCKTILSASIVTLFFESKWPLEILFGLLKDVFNIQWSAREWTFRVTLDMWIVYIGMLTSILVIKIREYRLTDHRLWPVAVKVAAVVSGVILVWFFGFELMQESKFTYNGWHPYISPLPVLAFAVLRNANATLRSAASRGFMFVGRCSLELFIMQYHFWLAGDTKGVLMMIPGTKWRPVNFVLTSFAFVYLCHRVANATGEVTKIVCAEPQQLPTVQVNGVPLATLASSSPSGQAGAGQGTDSPSDLESGRKGMEESRPTPEPDTPIRPVHGRWIDRLADGPSPPSTGAIPSTFLRGSVGFGWMSRVEGRIVILLCCMWILNVLWTFSE